MQITLQTTNPTENVNHKKVNLATLLDSNKILPHYENIRERILTGGGGIY